MTFYVKNMVCHRCRLAVEDALKKINLTPVNVQLGEVAVAEDTISPTQLQQLTNELEQLGFELLDDKKKKLIEQIKTLIIELTHYKKESVSKKYSAIIQEKLHHDYSYLSKLFSEVEGITIEQYIISQKIEKTKELLVYDELSLSEIAFQLNYSSVAHLSTQFKKITGLTPSEFKKLSGGHRKPLDQLKPK
jgi:AraC-like DNA-binding protein